jgi:hypothetical protein
MAITFPNNARSYDESARRIRFAGHDGMFEIRFLVEVDALKMEPTQTKASEHDYLAAFDRLRTKILEVAKRAYSSKRKNLIVLGPADFK